MPAQLQHGSPWSADLGWRSDRSRSLAPRPDGHPATLQVEGEAFHLTSVLVRGANGGANQLHPRADWRERERAGHPLRPALRLSPTYGHGRPGVLCKQGSWACQFVPDRARNRAHRRSLTVNEPSQRSSWSRCLRPSPSQADAPTARAAGPGHPRATQAGRCRSREAGRRTSLTSPTSMAGAAGAVPKLTTRVRSRHPLSDGEDRCRVARVTNVQSHAWQAWRSRTCWN
jgi:hypothetical protein